MVLTLLHPATTPATPQSPAVIILSLELRTRLKEPEDVIVLRLKPTTVSSGPSGI